MTRTHHTPRRLLAAAVPVLAAGLLLAGCGGSARGSAADPTADTTAAASSATGTKGASATPTDPKERALAYSQCMRDNGVANFPDPQDGRLMIGPDSGVDPRSPDFQKAQEACQALSPQNDKSRGGKPLDPQKVADWAACVRANGVPDFPDPQIEGGTMSIELSGVAPDSPKLRKAMDACKDKNPGGGVMIKGGPR
jgi:hypothetical protein